MSCAQFAVCLSPVSAVGGCLTGGIRVVSPGSEGYQARGTNRPKEAAMKFKTVVILAAGAAIVYALNTEGGRNQLSKVKGAGQRYLGRPDVQAKADDLAEK